jgi:predicted HTH transcriptional regulator
LGGPRLQVKQLALDGQSRLTQGEKRNAFKTVVAFANGDGGTIVFGIKDIVACPNAAGT